MSRGIRAEVRIERPGDCQVPAISEESEVVDVLRSPTSPEETTVEVTVKNHENHEACLPRAESVFEFDTEAVYRLHQPRTGGCVCQYIEQLGSPVRDLVVEDGTVTVSFLVANLDNLQRVIRGLKSRFGGVFICRLTRSETECSEDDLVYVDRSTLTERQREVLCVAHEQGYFEHPRGANACELAERLDIAPATFGEHLAAAQRKIMDAVLDEA
jgi:predicted DNA binding protein